MKNYKFLVPIVMVVLYALSIYMLYDTRATIENNYQDFLATAREYREIGVELDAAEAYKQALSLKPSVELHVEYAEFYEELGNKKYSINEGLTIIETYPKESEGYEYLIDVYKNYNDYRAMYKLYNTMIKRGASSRYVEDVIASVDNVFYIKGGYNNVGVYGGGLCAVQTGEKWGYVDEKGEVIIDRVYAEVGDFIETYAPVLTFEGEAYFVDAEGNKRYDVTEKVSHDKFGMMDEGMISVYSDGQWDYYTTDEEHAFGGYDEATTFAYGIAVVKKEGKWMIVDGTGKQVIDATYEDVILDEKEMAYRNDRLFVSDGDGYDMIDLSGNVISKEKYEDARLFYDGTYAAVKINGLWGFIDNGGNIIIEPRFEEARSFQNGKAAVQINGLWGYIDENGEVLIQPQFEGAKEFNASGCAFVKDNELWTLLCLYKYNYED